MLSNYIVDIERAQDMGQELSVFSFCYKLLFIIKLVLVLVVVQVS